MKNFNVFRFGALLCLLTLTINSLLAVPAYRGWRTVTQPDGSTITVRQMGDEFYHFWETQDGKIARQQSDGTFVVTDENRPTHEQIMKRRMASKKYMPRVRKAGSGSLPARALFILVSFSNQTFMSASETYYKTTLGDATDGAMSMYNYLKEQSNGAYNPPVDVYGPYNLNKAYSVYGTNVDEDGNPDDDGDDVDPAQMIYDACVAADGDINFSLYDANNDGKVDNVYVIYAGKGEADGGVPNTVWPHQWDIAGAGLSLTLDGKKIRSYACSAELNRSGKCAMGTPLHEFGHVIGLPDYYDITYETSNNSDHLTPNDWSIMDGGSYNNDGNTPPNYSIFDKYFMGWATPNFLAKSEKKNVTLTTNYGDAYQITGGTSGPVAYTNTGTVYYIENRQKSGWDEYLPGHGLIIWKVQYNSSAWSGNTLNSVEGTTRYTLVSADGGTTIGNVYDNYGQKTYNGGNNSFPGLSNVKSCTPATGCEITEIKESAGVITFKYNGGVEKTTCTFEFLADNCTTPEDGSVTINAPLSITITPNSGYSLADASCWTVEMGGVELTYGTDFTYTPATNTFYIASLTDDVVIMAEAKVVRTVTWSVNGSTTTIPASTFADGAALVLPSAPGDCESGKKFVGWTAISSVSGSAPADLFTEAGTKTVSANTTYYAVYATASGGGSTSTLLSEDFSSITNGNSTSTSGSSSSWSGNTNITNVNKAYQAGGAVKIGGGSATGYIRTKALSALTGSAITVAFDVKGWSTVEGDIRVTVQGCDAQDISYSAKMSDSFESKSVDFTLLIDNPTVTIATTAKRAFIDNVVITTGGSASYSEYSLTCDAPIVGPTYTVTWKACGETFHTQTFNEGAALALPSSTPADNAGKSFAGWTTTEHHTGSSAPADLFTTAGSKTVTGDITYYAVFH